MNDNAQPQSFIQSVLYDKELTDFQKLLFLDIHNMPTWYKRREKVAEQFDKTEKTVSVALTALKNKGYIYEVSFNGRKKVWTAYIKQCPELWEQLQKSTVGSYKNVTPPTDEQPLREEQDEEQIYSATGEVTQEGSTSSLLAGSEATPSSSARPPQPEELLPISIFCPRRKHNKRGRITLQEAARIEEVDLEETVDISYHPLGGGELRSVRVPKRRYIDITYLDDLEEPGEIEEEDDGTSVDVEFEKDDVKYLYALSQQQYKDLMTSVKNKSNIVFVTKEYMRVSGSMQKAGEFCRFAHWEFVRVVRGA